MTPSPPGACRRRRRRGEDDPIADAFPGCRPGVVPQDAVAAVANGRLAGSWFAGCAAGTVGDTVLLVTERREPLAIAGRESSGLWKILRGI